MLLKAGANPDARDKYGKTALMWAAAAGNEKVATMLWKGGADLRAVDSSGWDALFAAAHGGHVRLVTVWMAGAELDRAAPDGTTALMAAAQAGRGAVVGMMLKRSADASLVNSKGQRALELARGGKHQEVVDMLVPATPMGPPPPRSKTAPARGWNSLP